MAISKITSAGVATDTLVAGDIAADAVGASEIAASAVGISELDNAATGIESTHHKVPVYADDDARDAAIGSPANGMIIFNTTSAALQQYSGTWSAIVPAPVVSSISGFLNEDNDSTLTIFGSSFSSASAVKMFDASTAGSQVGSNATTTFVSSSKLTAVFGAGSLGSAGDTVYIEVDNAGVTTRFGTAITLNADPTVALSGNTGTGADATDHLGTYGGSVVGGGNDEDTVLLLSFDRPNNSTDFEDHSNVAGLVASGAAADDKVGHKITSSGVICSTAQSKFGTNEGKANASSGYFNGASGARDHHLNITNTNTGNFGAGNFTIDYWIKTSQTGNYRVYSKGTHAGGQMFIRPASQPSGGEWFKVYTAGTTGGIAITGDGTERIADNAWHHVAFVRTQTHLKAYVDGIERSSTTSLGSTAIVFPSANAAIGIGKGINDGSSEYFVGYLEQFRLSTTARWTTAFTPPTKIYGATESKTIPTITLTGTATQLAADEDIEFTSVANTTKAANNQHLTDSGIGLTLTNLTGGDKSKATLTGTIASAASTTHSNMPIKAQVRKTLGNAAYANASRVVTFSSSTTTAGLAPAMPVTGTGIPAATTITSVDSSTTITLSANPTGGTLTGQSLIFEDLTRITHINGSDTLNNADTMMTIATGEGEGFKLFNARHTMGTGAARAVTGYGFTPDLVWIKGRDMSDVGRIMDTLRTLPSFLTPSTDSAISTSTDLMTSMDSDGYTLKTSAGVNQNDIRFIAWGWKGGGTPSANGKRKTDGTEADFAAAASPSTSLQYTTGLQYVKQSVNSVGDFSITRYQAPANTEPGSAPYPTYKIPHGLSGQPDFFTIKGFNNSRGWATWHQNFADLSQSHMFINTATAVVTNTDVWADTDPDSTHISLRHNGPTMYNGEEYMMYAWKAVAGVSSFGTYSGGTYNTNASACGFKPRFLMIKQVNGTGQWNITDAFRGYTVYTGNGNYLNGDSGGAEDANSAYGVEFVTNGFHAGSSDTINGSGHTYIYIAFA